MWSSVEAIDHLVSGNVFTTSLISKYRHFNPSGSDYYAGLIIDGNGTILTRITGQGTDVLDRPADLALGEWHHFAFVLNAVSGWSEIYLDGQSLGTGFLTFNGPISAEPLRIGQIVGAGDQSFEGVLDEIRIYDRALTPQEIGELAKLPPCGTLLSDDFEDEDASGWQVFSGGWSEAGGVYHDSNTTANVPVASVWPGGYGWTDYSVEADVRALTRRKPSDAGVVFRFQSDYPNVRNCACRLASDIRGLNFQLICSDGTFEWTPYNWNLGTWYRLRATAIGNSMTCEILGDPSSHLDASSPTIESAGTVGFRGTHLVSDYDNVLVEPIDCDRPPAALCRNVEKAADANCLATVLPEEVDNGSKDPDDDPVILSLDPEGPFALGSTDVVLTAMDPAGASASCSATVTVVDTTAPRLSLTAIPDVLWPPNHQMVEVNLALSASDACDTNPTCTIAGVTSNEDINGAGDGDTTPDWQAISATTLLLRSERSGVGDGREYEVEVNCVDDAGNVGSSSVVITVPKSRGH